MFESESESEWEAADTDTDSEDEMLNQRKRRKQGALQPQSPPSQQQPPPCRRSQRLPPGHFLTDGNGFVELTDFFASDPALLPALLAKQSTTGRVNVISGKTTSIPAWGRLAERVQACARSMGPLRRAVEEASGAKNFTVTPNTCQKLIAENDQIPHADDYCPGELFVTIHLRDSQTPTHGVPFRESSLDM